MDALIHDIIYIGVRAIRGETESEKESQRFERTFLEVKNIWPQVLDVSIRLRKYVHGTIFPFEFGAIDSKALIVITPKGQRPVDYSDRFLCRRVNN